jgi:hypothetical protein
VHLDAEAGTRAGFGGRIAHGALTVGFVSAAMGDATAGPAPVYLSQSVRFLRPVRIGDAITTRVEIVEVKTDKRELRLSTECRQPGRQACARWRSSRPRAEGAIVPQPPPRKSHLGKSHLARAAADDIARLAPTQLDLFPVAPIVEVLDPREWSVLAPALNISCECVLGQAMHRTSCFTIVTAGTASSMVRSAPPFDWPATRYRRDRSVVADLESFAGADRTSAHHRIPRTARRKRNHSVIGEDSHQLQAWSVEHPEAFWRAVWHDADVLAMGRDRVQRRGKACWLVRSAWRHRIRYLDRAGSRVRESISPNICCVTVIPMRSRSARGRNRVRNDA